VSDPVSGLKRVKTLQEPSETAIRAWAAARGVPILEIDPRTLDTTRWSRWYRYWTQVPLSNGFGTPLLVGDVDQNNKPEVYGNYHAFTSRDFEGHIYEIDSTGHVQLLYVLPQRGITTNFLDRDRDSLVEVAMFLGDSTYFYEQRASGELPIIRQPSHANWEYTGSAIFTYDVFAHLDDDTAIDYLYRGSERHPNPDSIVVKTYVAEYNLALNRFQRVWDKQIAPFRESSLGGYVAGDFDGDARMEFIATEARGRVYLFENAGNNNFEMTWRDSLPFLNLFYQLSGDVDGDNKMEFYVGATTSTGNWTTMYEADSNNHYSPRFMFHLLSGGVFDEPIYLETDIENDGRRELVIMSEVYLYVFKSPANDSFTLWYFKREDSKQGVQFYDFNRDGRKDFIISKAFVNPQGQGRLYADVYLASNIVGVTPLEDRLPQTISLRSNYPNPFNPSTSIVYEIPEDNVVQLVVLTVEGRVLATLVNERKHHGVHQIVWNGNDYASGVYFCRLTVGNLSLVEKLLLIR
jgi:hypothetical protein